MSSYEENLTFDIPQIKFSDNYYAQAFSRNYGLISRIEQRTWTNPDATRRN